MQAAVRKQLLKSATYQRLALSLVAWSTLHAAAVHHPAAALPALLVLVPSAAAYSAAPGTSLRVGGSQSHFHHHECSG